MVWMVRLHGSEGTGSMVGGLGLLAEGWCIGGSWTSTRRNSRGSKSKELLLVWLDDIGISPQYLNIVEEVARVLKFKVDGILIVMGFNLCQL